jgi:hypothetical protein
MGKKSFRQRIKAEKSELSRDMRKDLVKRLLEMLAEKRITVGNVPELAQLLPILSSYVLEGERVTLGLSLFSCGAVLDLTLPKYQSDSPSVSMIPIKNTTQSQQSAPSHEISSSDGALRTRKQLTP